MKKSEINKIEKSKKVEFCYIRKGGSYYRPNHCGYTERLTRAGVYPKAEAIDSARRCSELTIIPINPREHNSHILNEVNEMLTRIL